MTFTQAELLTALSTKCPTDHQRKIIASFGEVVHARKSRAMLADVEPPGLVQFSKGKVWHQPQKRFKKVPV
jgi:hypothetical protein